MHDIPLLQHRVNETFQVEVDNGNETKAQTSWISVNCNEYTNFQIKGTHKKNSEKVNVKGNRLTHDDEHCIMDYRRCSSMHNHQWHNRLSMNDERLFAHIFAHPSFILSRSPHFRTKTSSIHVFALRILTLRNTVRNIEWETTKIHRPRTIDVCIVLYLKNGRSHENDC